MTLYFAYGSNLNKAQMKMRCPDANPIGHFILDDARLVFRGVADVIAEEGARCEGGIWKITPRCEDALDRYEGFDPRNEDNGMYRKVYLQLATPIAGETELMLYVMNSTGIMPPSKYYLDVIKQGYRDFGIKMKHLNDAVEASHDDKAPSHIERQRHRRKGRPELAARPSEAKQPKPMANQPSEFVYRTKSKPVSKEQQRANAKAAAKAKPANREQAARAKTALDILNERKRQAQMDLFRRAMTVYGD